MVKKTQSRNIIKDCKENSHLEKVAKKASNKNKKLSEKTICLSTRQTRKKINKNYNIEKIQDESNFLQTHGKFESPMLASTYDASQNITGWYLSEKLDGIRCIWDGKALYSRNGNLFYPPNYFIDKFPKNLMLDGELFMDRHKFQETVSIVKKQYENDGWKKIKFIIFDGPKIKGDFTKRLEILEKELKQCSSPYLVLHKQEVCSDTQYLEKKMIEIISMKGEGVILRDPKSQYENRRSKSMLKVKEFHDAEATVIALHKGTGRLQNMMGAIECKNKEGIIFKIGTGFSDRERANPPKIGTIVSYRYFELTNDNIPRFPSFLRVYPGL